jgi:hypothetical protein
MRTALDALLSSSRFETHLSWIRAATVSRETDTPTTMASNSLKSVNPNAEIMSKAAALFMNINAAKGLQDVMKSNLGPKGTIKMLVGGAGGKELEA